MNSIRIHLNTVRAYQRGEIKWQRRTERPTKVRQDKMNPRRKPRPTPYEPAAIRFD